VDGTGRPSPKRGLAAHGFFDIFPHAFDKKGKNTNENQKRAEQRVALAIGAQKAQGRRQRPEPWAPILRSLLVYRKKNIF
jgi:hypothetical protein